MSEKVCEGCGITLNYTDPTDIGYVHPKSKGDMCQRCFQMIHFNKVPDTYLQNEQYQELFKEVVDKDKLIIWVIDIFDFNSSYQDFIVEQLKDKPVLIIANKVDILPKSIKQQKIKEWIKEFLSQDLKIIDIIVTSAIKKQNIDEILEKIYLIGSDEAYIVGTTNVGKSTLINKLIKSVDASKEEALTTSYYAGTTLGLVGVILDDNLTIYDTPGIINTGEISQYLTNESLKIIIPKTELKPTTFQLYDNQTLFITGLAQVDFLKGSRTNFTVYAANTIDIHRTNYDNAQKIRTNHLGNKLLQVPTIMELADLKDFKTLTIELTSDHDIFISGLCFIAVKGVTERLEIQVTVPSKVTVDVRTNLI